MRRRDAVAAEEGFWTLHEHAAEHVDDLLRAFDEESDHGLRCWLLELIGEARSPASFETLGRQLRSDDESLRYWAIRGLSLLGTKEARTLLWDAQSWELETEEASAEFRWQIREASAEARGGTL